MIRYIKPFEVIFSRNNLSGMHISAMCHNWNVYKYFCPLSVEIQDSISHQSSGLNTLSVESNISQSSYITITQVCYI